MAETLAHRPDAKIGWLHATALDQERREWLNPTRLLTSGLGVYYVLSQIITIGLIVPLNYVLNRSFTFSDLAAQRS